MKRRLSVERPASAKTPKGLPKILYIEDDERVEVTPKSIRLRKAILDPNDRKRAERAKEAEVG